MEPWGRDGLPRGLPGGPAHDAEDEREQRQGGDGERGDVLLEQDREGPAAPPEARSAIGAEEAPATDNACAAGLHVASEEAVRVECAVPPAVWTPGLLVWWDVSSAGSSPRL